MGELRDRPLFTVDQYLAIERASEDRHEYVDGVIYDMAGESLAHGLISANVVGTLFNQLKGTPCFALTKDSKIRSGPQSKARVGTKGMFSYPDILVVCGEPEYFDSHRDVILNPKVIIEILSPSTETFDRGEKCERYQTWNPTLTDYVIISQDEPCVEIFSRKKKGNWSFERFSGVDAVAPLPAIRCELPLRDVYDRVRFPSEEQ